MASVQDFSDVSELSPLALQRLIEGEIIPRLLIAHRAQPSSPPHLHLVNAPVADGTALSFARAALKCEAYALLVDIDAQLARGVTVETVFLDILAPAARHLGEMWENDTCDFVDVTMALWRLQEIVHELGARMPGAAERRGGERRALFAPMPGEQHGFGSLMVEEFFRRAGWVTASEPGASEAELLGLVGKRWFELVGLTVACSDHIGDLPRVITALRTHSRNPHLGVMVGGRVFVEQPDLAADCGADGTAADGRQAVQVAEALVESLMRDGERTAAARG